MRSTVIRVAVSLLTVLSFVTAGQLQLGTGTASAQSWRSNPAPFQSLKVGLTTPALLGLQRQRAGEQAQLAPGGANEPNPMLPQPQKPAGNTGQAGGSNQGGLSPPGPQGGINSTPRGSIVFNNDPSAIEQNETSVTVRQNGIDPTAHGASNSPDQVVGGVNDSRGFYFVPGLCGTTPGTYCYPARNCVSLSGFSVSLDGGQSVSKSGCLPFANSTFQPFGDPALDRDTAGNVYYGSLGFDTTSGSTQNGIILDRSTPALFDSSNQCQNATPASNPCWTGRVVSVGTQTTNPADNTCDSGFCTFADKDWVAVDRYSATQYQGDVYVTWNSFTVAGPKNGQSQMLLSRCHPDASNPTGFDSCTTPITVSRPDDVYTGGGSYVTVTRDGHVLVSYINFGTATTLYPIDYRIAVLAPGGQTVEGYITQANLTQNGDSSTLPCLPNRSPSDSFEAGAACEPNTAVDAAAGVTFRLPEFYKIDANRSVDATRANNTPPATNQSLVYTTFELCTLPQYYEFTDQHENIVYPGNCSKSDVFVATTTLTFSDTGFTNTPSAYSDITQSAPGQQFFPSVSVDDGTGEAVVTYNSTQDDPFQNMDSVYAQESTDGGQSFVPLRSTAKGGITDTPYQITKDPAGYFGQGSPPCGTGNAAATGCPGYAPENGDYLESVAFFGTLYTHYTGTYLQKGFFPDPSIDALTFFDAAYPMNQDDNFLARNQLMRARR